ncbi:zinc ribbon domain-containing protein [Butyrivibrio sp. AD3002]|uniref:zinc ribbon domain-containing protein n=1 Tax=Butyrivibrio sp. AD3002 TaxID=1280670 RepID=UPI0003B5D963|nr:zinc ribbon domain-containing protein [Butyrivibrio sp. AD3002]
MSIASIITLILGITIWLIFNSMVTRWYFGTSCLGMIASIIGEMIVCIMIAGFIVELVGQWLGGVFVFVGGLLAFLIKTALIIIGISAFIGVIYFIYCKVKGIDFNPEEVKSKIIDGAQSISHKEIHQNTQSSSGSNTNVPSVDDVAYRQLPNNNSVTSTSTDSDYIFCSKCGKKIVKESKFCPYCGKDVIHL